MNSKITVVTYNIQHGRGADGKFNLERTAYVLAAINPDIILLQEADCWRPNTKMTCQPRFLANLLHMEYAYGPVKHYRPGSYGNAVLSRHPILGKINHSLPAETDRRCCLEVKIEIEGIYVTVFNLHLGLNSSERYQHLQEIILPRIKGINGPVLLGGDFNCRPDSPEIALIEMHLQDSFQVNYSACCYTYPSSQPCYRIDYLFLNHHWQIDEYKIIPHTLASDHLPVMVKIVACPADR